jgi:hypothetical protein
MSEQKTIATTTIGTLAFDKHLFEADEKGRFKAAVVVDGKSDLNKLNDLIKEAIALKWPKGKPTGLKMPIKKETREDMVEKYPFLKDNYVINATTKFEIQVIDKNNEPLFRPDIKAGDKVRFAVSAYAYDANGNKGVGFNVHAILKVEDGEALFNKPSVANYFGIQGQPAQESNVEFDFN